MIRRSALTLALFFATPRPAPAGAAAPRPPAPSPNAVSFVNDVLPVLTKAGCNAGACHGSQYGKGGFKLSLQGYAPELDHLAITREAKGRRIARAEPERSLLLRKPSGAAPHGGGIRLPVSSAGYRIMREWLRTGAPGPAAKEPRLTAITLAPGERVIARHERPAFRVTARYDNGTTRDVTRLSRFFSNHDNVASVDDIGRATVVGTGEAVIRAHYGGQVAIARVLVPHGRPAGGSSGLWALGSGLDTRHSLRARSRMVASATPRAHLPRAQSPEPRAASAASPIDTAIAVKLRRLGIVASGPCTDEQFLRRATLDLVGTLPSAAEARQFLASRDPNKREKWIEALMARPEYVDAWSYRLGDLFRNSRRALGSKGMTVFHRYLREVVAKDRPWDAVARELITARGSLWEVGPANYFGPGGSPEEWAEATSQLFLGVRIQCARCHNHPFDRWSQEDYFRFAAFFARTKKKSGGEQGDTVLFVADEGEVKHPRTEAVLSPRPLGDKSSSRALPEDADRRDALARWLTAPENPWFARAIVNRVWKHLMGRGLIEPVDDLRATNPASNEGALAALTRDFVANDYRLKPLIRVICRSDAYQRSSEVNPTNRNDETQFSRHGVRRLGAEQLLDAVVQVTGVPEKFPGVPLGARAAALPDTAVPSYFLDLFGRPARASVCECERETAPNLAQTLHVMNGDAINARIRAPEGHLSKLLTSAKTDGPLLEELFLTTLTRLPTPVERRGALTTIRQAPSRPEGFADLLWALLNSREFLFSH